MNVIKFNHVIEPECNVQYDMSQKATLVLASYGLMLPALCSSL